MPNLLDIVGQDDALAQLQRAAAGQRRPHALLLVGPEGVGRETAAVEYARLLLCHTPLSRPNAAPAATALIAQPAQPRLPRLPPDFTLRQGCGKCPSCLTLSASTNPDFQLVHKELGRYLDDDKARDRKFQDLGIDVIRQFVIAPAYRGAMGGQGKAFVIRGAEDMSVPAQNALLKTLEEPPSGVTIILICASASELLPTTRSRCRLVRFHALPLEFVAGELKKAGVKEAEASFWAGQTDGSLGQSQRLADDGLYAFKRDLVERLATLPQSHDAKFAEALTKEMEKYAGKLTRRDEDLVESVAKRQAGQIMLSIIASVYRDALRVGGPPAAGSSGQPARLVHADQAPAIARIAQAFPPTALADILTQLARFEQLLWRNVNVKLLWDNVAVTCASAAPLSAELE